MRAKEIEKLIRRYIPAKTLLGSNREKFIAELQELHQIGIQEQVKNNGVLADVRKCKSLEGLDRCQCPKEKIIISPPNERRQREKKPSVCANCKLPLKDGLQPFYIS